MNEIKTLSEKKLRIGEAYLRSVCTSMNKLEQIGQTWRPYRSIASWYLWRMLD
jgi:3-methyladenine DNA glycosylase/8-oxoguanine DNA glycosylase